jgi:hypothetical protein
MKYVSIIILIFAIGCQQQEAPLEQTLYSTEQHSFLTKPPSYSGPYVVRAEYPIFGEWFIFSDPKTNLTALFGVDLFAACSDQGYFLDIMPVIDIYVPEDPNRIIEIQKGEVHTYVYEGLYTGGPICPMEVIAYGMSDVVLTDNDLLTFSTPDNKNANAFGYMLHGKLTTPAGETVVFNAMSRSVWDGWDPETFKSVSKINLK